MRVTGILLAAVVFASSCASSPQPRKTSAETTYDCNYEQPTGSNIMKLDCRTLQRENEDRAEAQQRMREMQMSVQPVAK